MPPTGGETAIGNHYRPRSRAGWTACAAFLALFALTQPPLFFLVGNRVEPRTFGTPFFFAYLLVLYAAMIGVLLWARRRGL
jgi:hypothetical protein